MIDPNSIRLIDIEASGLGPESYPIEIAYSPREGEYESFLINPDTAADWDSWDPMAETMHGIARADAVEEGQDVMFVARRLNEALGKGTLYSDGYDQDLGWITRLYDEVVFEPTFRLASLQGVLERYGTGLAAKYDELVAINETAHRAEADLQRIRELLRQVVAMVDR